jgi:hypothetical protein
LLGFFLPGPARDAEIASGEEELCLVAETLEGCDAIQTQPARLRAGRAPCEWVAKRG